VILEAENSEPAAAGSDLICLGSIDLALSHLD
jgi:hypothetical protein